MVGDLWRWGINDDAMQKDLGKTWRQLVRWLVSDVPPRISVESEPTDDPTQVRLIVKARDEEFKPLDNAAVKLTIRPVQDSAGAKALDLTAEASPAVAGRYEATYVAREAGAYCVEATVTSADGKPAGRAATGWTSDPAVEEFQTLKPNRAILEKLAKRTGGEIVAMDQLTSFVRHLPERSAPIKETKTEPLWRQPAVFVFVLVCLLAEWGLRRWKGMP
jgi:hypothetical protein